MRQLTARQKKVIDKAMAANPDIGGWDELELETIDKLETINDTEILPQEVNRYINDQRFARLK